LKTKGHPRRWSRVFSTREPTDEASAQLAEVFKPGYIETVALALSHTFASTGAVVLTCNDFKATAIVAYSAKITLVQVQTLSRSTGIAPS
jgi:hypothetical protein